MHFLINLRQSSDMMDMVLRMIIRRRLSGQPVPSLLFRLYRVERLVLGAAA